MAGGNCDDAAAVLSALRDEMDDGGAGEERECEGRKEESEDGERGRDGLTGTGVTRFVKRQICTLKHQI